MAVKNLCIKTIAVLMVIDTAVLSSEKKGDAGKLAKHLAGLFIIVTC